MNEFVALLIYLLLAGILVYVVQIVLSMLTIPSQIKTIILIVVALVFLLWILRAVGIFVF